MSKRVALPQGLIQELTRWYPEQLVSDTPFLQGSAIGWLFGLFGQAAVTIDQTVHLTRHAPDLASRSGVVLIGHELFHVLQQKEMGWWGFLARYVWHWRPSHVKNGRKHSLEGPAYARGDEILHSVDTPP